MATSTTISKYPNFSTTKPNRFFPTPIRPSIQPTPTTTRRGSRHDPDVSQNQGKRLKKMSKVARDTRSERTDKHNWKNPESTNVRRNWGRVIDDKPELFRDDELPRPPGKQGIAKVNDLQTQLRLPDGLDDSKEELFRSLRNPFFDQVNLLETLHNEQKTVSLIVGTDPTIQLRCENQNVKLRVILANKCFQRRDTGEWYLLRRSCEGAGYASYPHPKTTEDVTVLGRNKSQILSGGREMDLFSLIRAPNPTNVKTGSRPCAPHEVPLLALTASQKSPLDFAHGDGASVQGTAAPEMPPPEDVPATATPGVGQAEEAVAAEPHMARESRSSHEGKSLAAMQLCLASNVFVSEGAPADVNDPDPLSFADAPSHHPVDVAQSYQGIAASGDPESENVSSPAEVGSPGSVYRPEWGVTNGSLLDTPEACQDLVDHAAPLGYFSELRHMHNEEFLRQYNVNLARQVAMGSQLRLRFEQEAKLLRKSVAQVAALQEQVSGEEKLKAAFEEFKRYEDDRVERRCVELDARLDALSIDFDDELYPHILTAIAGRRWVIGHGLRLAMMKCAESREMRQAFADVVSARVAKGMSEGLKHGVEHGRAQLEVESIEAYDPEAEAKFVAALQSLRDLKYPLLDQLEGLNDAPIDVIMAALYLKSDTGGDAPQHIRDLRPSSSQLTIPVYPEVRDLRNPWAYKEEMKLSDAIAANISRAEKKKKCRIVCRTYGVGSAHHARSDGVPVSVPTVVPQGLALLLVDATTQTDLEDTVL
nr:hypothetical protein [Tanacetum cinerariifolium]